MAVAFPPGMRTRSLLGLSLVLSTSAALPLVAQDERPRRGKIDGVERERDKSTKDGDSNDSDCDCSAWWIEIGEGIVHVFTPRGAGRGYRAYPYSWRDSVESDSPFLVRDTRNRSFGTLSLSVFDDAGSTLSSARFAFAGAAALAYWSFEFSGYREPLQTNTDHLYAFRLGMGVMARPGPRTMLRMGFAARGIVLDDGSSAAGPELELGAQLLPRRPFGVSVLGRVGALDWEGGGDLMALRELNTTGSIFVGRWEFQAGWHWMKLGSAPAFGGPMLGTRIWF